MSRPQASDRRRQPGGARLRRGIAVRDLSWIFLICAIAVQPAIAQEHTEFSGKDNAGRVIVAREAAADEQAAMARERALIDAERRKDAKALLDGLADDFLEISPDGTIVRKADVAPHLATVEFTELSTSDMQAHLITPDVVLVTYIGDAKAVFQAQPVSVHARVSSVWARRAGKWQLVFHQATPIPEK